MEKLETRSEAMDSHGGAAGGSPDGVPEEGKWEEGSGERRRMQAELIIRKYSLLAMGAGLIPIPVVDVVATGGLEVMLIAELARLYEFKVPEKLVFLKLLVTAAGSILPVYVSIKTYSFLRTLPWIGHTLFSGLISIASGATMYAVGRIFQEHYESGGTFLSLNNAYLKRFFEEKYEEGRQVVPGYVG